MHLVLLVIVKLFQKIPEKCAIKLGIFLSLVLHRIIRFRYNVIYNQIKVTYGKDKSDQEIEELIKKIYRHLGMTLIEILRLPGISKEKLNQKIIFHGEEIAKKALSKGQGVIVLTGHIGNWELIGPAWVQKGYPINVIGKEMKSSAGNTFIHLIRGKNGVVTIPRKNSLKQIFDALGRNEAIGVMLDQNMTYKEGIFVDFFDQKACTMPALGLLAERSEAAILPVYIYRDNDLFHHHIVVLPEIKLKKKSRKLKTNINQSTSQFTKTLEDIIKKHPDQWLWIHKRWRTRPPEEESSMFNY